MPIEISVVIPTRNRADSLRRSLIALCEQICSPDRFEICVVNNDSSDHTSIVVDEIIQKYADHRIFMMTEKILGSTAARNAGLACTTAPLIAFAEDDAITPADWIHLFLHHFSTLGPDLAKVGGEIIPLWDAPRPEWLTDGMLELLSATSGLGDTARFLDYPTIMIEPNCCYRRDALVKAGGFPTSLGRRGNLLLSGEHIVDILLYRNGGKIYYDPAIRFYHQMHAARLMPNWFRQRCLWQGITDYGVYQFLRRRGISVREDVSLDLPLAFVDWTFVNNDKHPPTEDELSRFRSLGFVLAKAGFIDISGE